MNKAILEITRKEKKTITVEGQDYTIAFPLPVVAELEEKLGRSMKYPSDWFRIQTKEVQAILEAGLTRHYPDDARTMADDICSVLTPEGLGHIIDGLCMAACPKTIAKLQADIDARRREAAVKD